MTVSNSIIQRAFRSGNPVIEGNRAVFIWQGRSAPYLMSDLNHWDDNPRPFKRVSPRLSSDTAKSIWSCTQTLPRDVYFEYAFYHPITQTNFLDPLNRKSVNNGVGGRNNFFYMPETMPSPFVMRRANVSPGALTSHRVDTWMLQEYGDREVTLYRPPVKEPVPLLVVYDGPDYLQRGKLAVIVDNLIAEKRIRPIAMAMLANGGRRRGVEYACSDATIAWLVHVILPLARKQLKILDIEKNPGSFGVLGASFGGLMSVYTGLRLPGIFGHVLSQSGVFEFEGYDFAAVDLIKHGHARGIKLWMDAGRLEFLLEDNRRMYGLLNEQGYDLTYREFSGGHNYTAWRDDVWRGLEALFPPR